MNLLMCTVWNVLTVVVFFMVDRECAALMGNLTVVHKKYSHAKLLGVAKLPHAASLCSAH
jgi:hypothetical protein